MPENGRNNLIDGRAGIATLKMSQNRQFKVKINRSKRTHFESTKHIKIALESFLFHTF
jgi:hypothetical protein